MIEKTFPYQNALFRGPTFESNMPYALRFMIDQDIAGMSWIELPENTYKIRNLHEKTSTSQLEVDINYDKIVPKPPEGEWSAIAPLRILSFDIECASSEGFPLAERDPVITIGNICKLQTSSEPFVKNVFTLDTCSNIVGVEVRSHKTEKELLKDWQDFILAVDADIITGYNIISFDLPYLINRAEHLKVPGFGKFGRVLNSISRVKSAVFQSKVMGMRETKDINIDGRIQLDMFLIMHIEHKLSSYSLNNVSYHFLKEQKEDVHHSIIYELHKKNADTRHRLAVYCLKDSYLPLKLMDKLMSLYNYTEMARVTGVPIRFLFTRGQQIKVASQLYRKAKHCDMLIPVDRTMSSGDQFEGADVLDPKLGFYREPIATLDFASLYPSIMMAHNLCYSTLMPKSVARMMDPSHYTKTPNDEYFVKPSIRKGLLPQILEELLGARKRAKDDLKKATDPFVKAVLDGRQLALKISANSVYGFTGAQIGQLPCLQISSSVTAFGREMINKTKELVENQFTIENGYKDNAVVIYGDTDSVMVKFGTLDRAEAMRLGREASVLITESFIKPIKLEFEKVYHPYLLLSKKRYAGLLYTNPDKYDKLDKKGLESVRRDNCQLARDVINTVLDKILIEQDIKGAEEFVKGTISDLLQNKIDLSLLVVTRAISKKLDKTGIEEEDDSKNKKQATKSQKEKDSKKPSNTYKTKVAHVVLAEKIQSREGGHAPTIGDRIAYVMVSGTKGSRNYENAEDPIYVLENNLPVDFQYYLERQLKGPLMRIFLHILPNPEALFVGEHTRQVYVPKVSQVSMLGKFINIKLQCLGCKVPVNEGAICASCEKKRMDIHLQKLYEVKDLQANFSELWTQCQRCQGSLHQSILCSNNDCPIFYRRKKVQKDIENSQKILDRFDNQW